MGTYRPVHRQKPEELAMTMRPPTGQMGRTVEVVANPRHIAVRSNHSLMLESRSRDKTWVGVAVLVVMGLFVVFLVGCVEQPQNNSSENTVWIDTAKGEVAAADTLLTEVALNCCIPVTAEDLAADYMLDHNVPPMARLIADGGKPDLSKDAEALMLLDSMLNGCDSRTRWFYFWIVSRTLKWSDGYYSEGLGYWGTEYLFKQPSEFIDAWSNLINAEEQRSWAWYLAAEENIGSEGYSPDLVMKDYRHRVDSATKDLPSSLFSARTALIHRIDSIYRELAKDDRPIDPHE